MSQPIVPVNVPFAEPSLKDLLDAHAKAVMLGLNCHAIATVESFTAQDSGNGRPKLTASMNYSKTYTVQQPNGGFVNQTKEYPALVDCPAMFLGGSGTVFQAPPAPGDECLIFFNDRDINNWWAGASGGPVASSRLHSFSDAIALVGFGKWKINDLTHSMLTNGNAKLGVGTTGGQVLIANGGDSLGAILGDLITQLEGFPGLSPIQIAALVAIGGRVSGLLE